MSHSNLSYVLARDALRVYHMPQYVILVAYLLQDRPSFVAILYPAERLVGVRSVAESNATGRPGGETGGASEEEHKLQRH